MLSVKDKIIKLANENNGIITSKIVSEAGISRGNLKYLSDRGFLQKTVRGVYVLPNSWDDEFINIQTRFKKGIFSNETALFLHDLTDRTPSKFIMTFPNSYNLHNVRKEKNILTKQTKEEFYYLGITTVYSPTGNKVRAYNMEKTLCDLIKYGSDQDLISDSFRRYLRRKDKNIPKLSEFSKILKVEKQIKSYLEVLL